MLNHRTRLTLITSGIAAVILSVIFYFVVGLLENLELRADRHTLDSALLQLVHDVNNGEKEPDVKEVYQAYPNVSFSIYTRDGILLDAVGRLPLHPQREFGMVTLQNTRFVAEGMTAKAFWVVGGIDWTGAAARLHRLELILAGLWALMVAAVGLVTWYAATATFKPLFRLTEQATGFSGADLSRRLDSGDKAEFGHFTSQLNSLLDRVEETARREEQFASDAAHELRTPLAILRGRIESTLIKKRSVAEYQHAMEVLIPEVDRLTRLVELLLRSATAHKEEAPVTELSSVVEETAARWLDRFEENGVHLDVQTKEAHAQIWSEEVQCIVENFLNNALRVSPEGSRCKVILETEKNRATIRVSDEGGGVPAELIPRVFDRFTRGETSRNRTSGGFGIGLAVCKNIVTTRGGHISVQNGAEGAEFKVELDTVAH